MASNKGGRPPKRTEPTAPMTLRLPVSTIETIKRMALELTELRGREVSQADVVIEAVAAAAPAGETA